eukprot:NODE_16529_length_990_cov_1.206257.p1 GENE.NODE_16529_length_990_cov_1.206257~~NODE_16529_length_990_cov_1.206257.p1  ORF type:complete len:252 (+),score=55.33 NODE_16529_length_990_cov_1.206257:34-756(+)
MALAAGGEELERALERARQRYVLRGSTMELLSKRLLALNLRKLGEEQHEVAPRSYVFLGGAVAGGSEYEAFVRDFKATQAIAVLRYLCDGVAWPNTGTAAPASDVLDPLAAQREPEGRHGRELPDIVWDAGPDAAATVDDACVDAALTLPRRLFDEHQGGCGAGRGGLACAEVSDVEWAALRGFSPGCARPSATAADRAPEAAVSVTAAHGAPAGCIACAPAANGGDRGIHTGTVLPLRA